MHVVAPACRLSIHRYRLGSAQLSRARAAELAHRAAPQTGRACAFLCSLSRAACPVQLAARPNASNGFAVGVVHTDTRKTVDVDCVESVGAIWVLYLDSSRVQYNGEPMLKHAEQNFASRYYYWTNATKLCLGSTCPYFENSNRKAT